ncbi:MAG: hypothetical protein ACI8ZB_004173 [Desulforhopalus sp.]|jgi:hypothetical protein
MVIGIESCLSVRILAYLTNAPRRLKVERFCCVTAKPLLTSDDLKRSTSVLQCRVIDYHSASTATHQNKNGALRSAGSTLYIGSNNAEMQNIHKQTSVSEYVDQLPFGKT